MERKENVWPMFEAILREHFPSQYDDDDEYWAHDATDAREFISGNAKEKELAGIEIVEPATSFYENFDYDNYPQGEEDQCFSIVFYEGKHYKIGLIYKSYGGYHFDERAYEVQPKTIEVVVYE